MSDPIAELMGLLARLPGIGERTALRLAYHVLGSPPEYAQTLGKCLQDLHARVRRCERCRNYTTEALCRICLDTHRDPTLLCVVARPQDLAALERSSVFRGRYYVLHGMLSPLDGMGPETLQLEPLFARIREDAVREVIVATPLSVEGEATALYLSQELRPLGVRATRIASGLPHGGELEYTDQVTLARALDGRREL
ncbi:MAG TPA: recombination mediator RecR [Polyangiales bacterium]|nr:recombination mediator RecR [Polyangiales bacterium]